MNIVNVGWRGFGLSLVLVVCPAALADEVDDYIKAAMYRQHIPGLTLAVLREGKVIKAQGYGLASVELNVPAKPETVFELASATKPFVATAIMLLAQDGKLSLEAVSYTHLTLPTILRV